MTKRVLLLYVGGIEFSEEILRSYLELQLVGDVTIEVVSHTAGADMTWENLVLLGQTIVKHYTDYDGFVVLHGVDNIIYSSTFLRFIFKQIGKPVVFTAAALPDDGLSFSEPLSHKEHGMYGEIGVRTNLVTAVQLATLDCSGVYLVYDSHIIRPTRALAQTTDETYWFNSAHEEDIARVQFGVQLTPAAPSRTNLPPDFDPRFNPNILVLPAQPGLTLPDLSSTAAIIVHGYKEQLLPSILDFPTNIPILVYTKTAVALEQLKNIILVPNITYQALYTKTLVTLGQTSSLAEFLEAFQTNIHGEFY